MASQDVRLTSQMQSASTHETLLSWMRPRSLEHGPRLGSLRYPKDAREDSISVMVS